MLGLVKSCIGTKFTSQFGNLIAVSFLLQSCMGTTFRFFPLLGTLLTTICLINNAA